MNLDPAQVAPLGQRSPGRATAQLRRSHAWLGRGQLWLWPLLGVLGLACNPHIGDDCQLGQDCLATGERLCDTTMPGGYCTILNCEPGVCPEESVCIAFAHVLSTVDGCADLNEASRYERTACMASCEDNSDCRSGYQCIDMRESNPWGAIVAESSGTSGKVCVVPASGADLPTDRDNGVCVGGESAGVR